ncbi:MAG: 2-phosphosulfolactate phosphatase [bacterium]
MNAWVHLTPAAVREEGLRGRPVVVLDVLRASTSIITAVASGARGVIPADSLEAATEISTRLGTDDVLLAGERDARRVEGCDLGNSPGEFTPERVGGRRVVLATTNGTRAIVRARAACPLMVGGYVNAGRIVGALEDREDAVIVCAGSGGAFALEDAGCAGYLLERLRKEREREVLPMNDGAWVALELGRRAPKSPVRLLRQAAHGRYLIEAGFEEDLERCGDVDSQPVLPVLRDHMIVASE